MKTQRLIPDEVKRIIELRQTGHSLPEISRQVGRGYGTVFRYIRNVTILPRYQKLWSEKRGGSKNKAIKERERARVDASNILLNLNKRDMFLILAALYWGEGTKKELNLINGDPDLIRTFVQCLRTLGIPDERLRVTLRIFADMDKNKAIYFWSRTLGISRNRIGGINILSGKKKGKLEFGMCRVRVSKGKDYFKLILAMIDFIKSEINAAVVQWIERGTPKP